MLNITYKKDSEKHKLSLTIKGHAGATNKGVDLICASASMLSYTLAQNVKIFKENGLLVGDTVICLENGNIKIRCQTKKDKDYYNYVLNTFDAIVVGFAILSSNYPNNVQLHIV